MSAPHLKPRVCAALRCCQIDGYCEVVCSTRLLSTDTLTAGSTLNQRGNPNIVITHQRILLGN